jgi:hypothetical protein
MRKATILNLLIVLLLLTALTIVQSRYFSDHPKKGIILFFGILWLIFKVDNQRDVFKKIEQSK